MEYGTTISVRTTHPDAIVRAGLAALLQARPHMSVIDAESAGALSTVQVCVTDHDDGIAQARASADQPGAAAILVVTQRDREWDVRNALTAGVRGYLLQNCSAGELRMAIELVARGQRYVTTGLTRFGIDNPVRNALTGRETDVLQLLAQGCCNKMIARELGIGLGTVKSHVKGVFDKLGATARTHAVALATQRGLVDERR